MVDVIRVIDLRYLSSVNTPDYPEPAWKHQPDMSAVAGVANRYWIWDAVAERPIPMDQAAQDAVDAAILESELDNEILKVDDIKDIIRAMSQLIVSELNDIKDGVARPTWTLATWRTALRDYLGT